MFSDIHRLTSPINKRFKIKKRTLVNPKKRKNLSKTEFKRHHESKIIYNNDNDDDEIIQGNSPEKKKLYTVRKKNLFNFV